MLADTISLIITGRPGSARTLGKEEETEKRLHAALRSGQPIVFIDNISGEVESDMLCQCISQSSVTFRLLSRTEEMVVENAALFLLTGNNLVIVGDLTRRILRSRIDPECERPEDRAFTTVRPDKLAAQNGPAYVWAALTVLRAFHVAGRPQQDNKPLGTFEDWSRLVRDALIWLGESDPCRVMEAVRFDDPKLERNDAALYEWFSVFADQPKTTEDVIQFAKLRVDPAGASPSQLPGLKYPGLRDALYAATGNDLNSTALGKWAGSIKGKVFCDYKMVQCKKYRGRMRWKVEYVGKAEPSPKSVIDAMFR
jgi:putative DNA primase/helicase